MPSIFTLPNIQNELNLNLLGRFNIYARIFKTIKFAIVPHHLRKAKLSNLDTLVRTLALLCVGSLIEARYHS